MSTLTPKRNLKCSPTVTLAIWTALWLLSVASVTIIDDAMARSVAITLLVLNAALGIGLIRATIQHMKSLDEMMQKIQLEAMGIALGVTVVGGLSYTLLQQSLLIEFETSIAHLVMAVTVVYLLAIAYGYRRHQ